VNLPELYPLSSGTWRESISSLCPDLLHVFAPGKAGDVKAAGDFEISGPVTNLFSPWSQNPDGLWEDIYAHRGRAHNLPVNMHRLRRVSLDEDLLALPVINNCCADKCPLTLATR
jgi:hypothetical protein